MIVRTLTAALLAAIALHTLWSAVWAHATFVRSDPPPDTFLDAAPERVQLWFTEPVEPGFSSVHVLDAAGQRVDLGSSIVPDDATSMVVSLPPLEAGAYTVAWRALSTVDGHVTRGVFVLPIGVEPAGAAPAVTPDPHGQTAFEASARWLGYLGATGLLGAFLFRMFVLGMVARRLGLETTVLPAVRQPLIHLGWAAWGLLLVGTLQMLALHVAVLSDADTPSALRAALGDLLFSTRFGLVWWARFLLVIGLALVLLRLGSQRGDLSVRHPSALAGDAALRLGAILGAGLLLTTSLASHSAAAETLPILAAAADWLHQMAVAVWVGGLFSLVLILPRGLRALPDTERWKLLAALVPRFSALAATSVGILAVTGLYMAWLHVGSVGALLETLYGQSLMVKLAIIAPLLLLGAANLLIIRPRLAASVGNPTAEPITAASSPRPISPPPRHPVPSELATHFRRLVRAEAALAVLVLLAAGFITALTPARHLFEQLQASRPLTMSAEAQDLRLTLSIAPARLGFNTFTVQVVRPDGRPLADAERVSLAFTYLDDDLGTHVEVLESQDEGRYVVGGPVIAVEGRWQAELLVRPPGQEDARTAFRFAMSPTSAQEVRPGEPAETGTGIPQLGVGALAGLGLALAGAALVVYVARTAKVRSAEGAMLILASAVVIGLGVFLALRPEGPAVPGQFGALRNPFPPTQESLAAGEQTYRAACQSCHGVDGRGDGPAAAFLNPRPADLREHMAAGHTDGELYGWIREGIPGTAMPAFRDSLTEEEIWHVINFIRTYGEQ